MKRPSIKQSQISRRSRSSLALGKKASSLTKKKDKKASHEVTYLHKLAAIDISKFCPHTIFNVLFINETDEYSNELLQRITEMAGEYEEVSYLTFITYEEVVGLLENPNDVVLPPNVKSVFMEIMAAEKKVLHDPANIPVNVLACLMKIKLIEVMYRHYANAVLKMQRRRKVSNDLKALTLQCMGGKKSKKGGSKGGSKKGGSKKDGSKKGGSKKGGSKKGGSKKGSKGGSKPSSPVKKVPSQIVIDYTSIPIETEDDIVFDDDIHHQIWFYIFQGFYNPNVLSELILYNNVQIPAILKFSAQPSESIYLRSISALSDFWDLLLVYLDGPRRCSYLENTFLMTYCARGIDLKAILEELIIVIRRISDIKLRHQHYIRHMEIFRTKQLYTYYPLSCFSIYNNILKKIPLELINVPVLLDTLLKQVCVSVDETATLSRTPSTQTYFDANILENNKCDDPCGIETFFKNKVKMVLQMSNIMTREMSFLVHENDHLTTVLNFYKKYGPLVYDVANEVLKNLHSLHYLNSFEEHSADIIHKHDIDPSTKTIIRNKDILLHFLYLFLFCWIDDKDPLPEIVENDFTKNLETYSALEFNNSCQIKIFKYHEHVEPEEEEEPAAFMNLYNPVPSAYFWKEKLESAVLLQEIFKAENEYLYWDKRFSPETDSLLIQFSNRLDEFGLNTKVYDESLMTPICLRDFCKYTTIEKPNWLQQNKPATYIRQCFLKETCPGAKRITEKTQFPDYQHLIEIDPPRETESDEIHKTKRKDEISFEKLIEEIKNCPLNVNIPKECAKSEKKKEFLVYDFGSKYFQVKGARTTFYSHDDVKITIDNTRLMDEQPKCAVSLDCRNNSLVLHSDMFYLDEDYNFHMNLADDIIVSFSFLKPTKKIKHSDIANEFLAFAGEEEEEEEEDTSVGQEITDITGTKTHEETVISVAQNYFDSMLETNLLNEEYNSSIDINFKPPESMLERLKEAVARNVPIYKVNTNFNHLKKIKSQFKIPLMTILRRILHNTIQIKDTEEFTKRYASPRIVKHEQEIVNTLNARIAFPNGLYISFYPSKSKRDQMEVKQEYLTRNKLTEQEEFRLFTRSGFVLIKKIDGSIRILKSNGDIMDYEKLDSASDDVKKWRLKPCHRKNIEDYKKRVSKLLKHQNEDIGIAVSRRAFYQTRKGYIMDPEVFSLLETFRLPYLKTSMLKFDGSRISLEGGKLRIKQVQHTTFANDFNKQEMYYERGDGFKCVMDREGKQLVEFVDGTKITSRILISSELADGYVYISLEFEYEHPSYATVKYDFYGVLRVVLNKNVVFKQEESVVSVKIDDDIVTTVDTERVLFEKACLRCGSLYSCEFNILPLVEHRLYFAADFIHATDSYDKHLFCDFAGNCRRNEDYIRGPINAMDCDHYSAMSYNKLLVVNRDLSGCQLWTEEMVNKKKKAMSDDENSTIIESEDAANPKVRVLKFTTNLYERYNNRFLNLPNNTIYGSVEPTYTTFQLVRKMLDSDTLRKFCEDLKSYCERAGKKGARFCEILAEMLEAHEMYVQIATQLYLKEFPPVEEVRGCICIKNKIGIPEKIERWRRECKKYWTLVRSKELPSYFKSDFCEVKKRPY